MSGEITSVQQQAYFCTTKAKQIKKNVFMAAGRTDIGNLSFFFFHSVIAMRQISASLCLKQMKTCFDPVKAEQAKYIRKSYVTPAPFKKNKK